MLVFSSNKLTFNRNDAAFRSLKLLSEDRRHRILEAQSTADVDFDDAPVRSKQRSRLDDDDDDYDEDVDHSAENGKVEEAKKVKKEKKPKKPKVTVVEAAAKIDAANLESFLVDILASFEQKEDIQMMQFVGYFGRAFSSVPLSHILDVVYKTSADWINHRSPEALSFFVLWSLDSILANLGSQKTVTKCSKKAVQPTTSKSQEKVYLDNIVASVAILKKLSDDWKVQATKLSPYEPLREILKNFRQKNEKALASEIDVARFFKDADKYCKIISGRVSQGNGGKACLNFVVLTLAVGAAALYPNMESVDFNKLSVLFNSQF